MLLTACTMIWNVGQRALSPFFGDCWARGKIVFSLSKNKKKRKWCESFFFAAVKSHFSCTNWSQKFFWEFFLHIRVKFFVTSLRVTKNFTRMCKKNSKKIFWLQWVQEKCDFAAAKKNYEHHFVLFEFFSMIIFLYRVRNFGDSLWVKNWKKSKNQRFLGNGSHVLFPLRWEITRADRVPKVINRRSWSRTCTVKS